LHKESGGKLPTMGGLVLIVMRGLTMHKKDKNVWRSRRWYRGKQWLPMGVSFFFLEL